GAWCRPGASRSSSPPGADGSRASWRPGPTGHIPCDGGTRAPRTLGSPLAPSQGPGQVVGHLDLARLDVGLDPDPDAIPDPDPGGFLDLLAEPNIGSPAVHRDRRSEGDLVDRRLDPGPGRSVRLFDVEG